MGYETLTTENTEFIEKKHRKNSVLFVRSVVKSVG